MKTRLNGNGGMISFLSRYASVKKRVLLKVFRFLSLTAVFYHTIHFFVLRHFSSKNAYNRSAKDAFPEYAFWVKMNHESIVALRVLISVFIRFSRVSLFNL